MATAGPQQMSFSVDTHLLRELGLLLVGRDSTALLELIKNSYDADASIVTVHATGLDGPIGAITVADDGNGMTFERFRSAFLRIAGREKEDDRRSPRFKRRYTGAKGIGRLAAHKLARELLIDSVPRLVTAGETNHPFGVQAFLDWDGMENHHVDLSDLGDSLMAEQINVNPDSRPGTTLTLSKVREPWGPNRLQLFLDEIRSCRPSRAITDPLPKQVLNETLLFEAPVVSEHGDADPGFSLDLTGQLEGGDELWPTLATRADYVIEIDSSPVGIRYGVAPTERHRQSLPRPAEPSWARPYIFAGVHPNPAEGPFFQARILVTEGQLARSGPLGRFVRQESGIRVFLEGFRVLPYGSPGDDWLKLDRDYVRRPREFTIDVDDTELPRIINEGFLQAGNRAYFGAVLLTESGAPRLQALVNREGFVPDNYFRDLESIVRAGPDLVTRVRTALARRIKAANDEIAKIKAEADARRIASEAQAARASTKIGDLITTGADETELEDADNRDSRFGETEFLDKSPPVEPSGPNAEQDDQNSWPMDDVGDSPGDRKLRELLNRATTSATAIKAEPLSSAGQVYLATLINALDQLNNRMEGVRNDQLTLRTLAGVGTQYTAFVHEVNGLLAQAQTLRDLLQEFPAERPRISPEQQRALRRIRDGALALVQGLARQTSYLTEIIGPDARRRRQRLSVHDRIESALRLLAPRISERGQRIENSVSTAVLTPPIFPAEMAIILTNLLSNAVKFAGKGGTISIDANIDDLGRLHLRVDNTGAAVGRADWERYFRPFESSTTNIDVVLGQGMGLGLPIVRSLLSDYEGEAQFVAPKPRFATAVEVILPDPRPEIGLRNVKADSQGARNGS